MTKSYLLTLLPLALCATVPAATFVYVNNDTAPNSVSAYSVASNGALTELSGSPFPTGGAGNQGVGWIAANRIRSVIANHKLFVANSGSHDISVMSIDPATGELNLVPGSPFAVTNSALGTLTLAATPDGKYLYAGDRLSSKIFSFSVAASGALTPIGSPLTVPLSPNGMVIAPTDGRLLAVVSSSANSIETYFITPGTGILSPVTGSPFAGPAGADAGVDCNCAQDRLFVGAGPMIGAYSIDPTGALLPITGSPFAVPVINANSVVLSPDDTKLFAGGGFFDSSVDAFTVASSPVKGALSPGSAFATGALGANAVATDIEGKWLFVGDHLDNKISVFNINSTTPWLTPVPGSPFPNSVSDALLTSLTVYPPKDCCPAPVISNVSASPTSLWPPNHKFVNVTIGYTVTEPCPDTCVLTVASNEPVDDPSGDWMVLDPHHVMLRADRLGDGTGRIYTITVICTNNSNGLSSGHTVTVVVPHDKGQ